MILLLASLPAAVSAETLHLVCLGAGSANRPTSTYGYARDNNGNSAWGQVVGQRSVPFDDQVNIEINDDGTGRIRVPRAMIPPVHGGADGWFELKQVQRSQAEITGKVHLNFANQPRLRLDRLSGRISLDGHAANYSGECAPFDPAHATQKF